MSEGDGPSDVSNGRKVWNDAMKRLALVAKLRVHVGVLASQGGEEAHAGGDITLIELAAIHEFGSPAAGIPERSFLRSTFRSVARKQLESKMSALCKAALDGRIDPHRAIDLLGLWAAAAVKRTITSGKTEGPEPQALKQSTIDRKGSSKPLVDTAQLVNSITHEIDRETA